MTIQSSDLSDDMLGWAVQGTLWTCQASLPISVTMLALGSTCGGTLPPCGTADNGPCVDGPWPGYQCDSGMSCIADAGNVVGAIKYALLTILKYAICRIARSLVT